MTTPGLDAALGAAIHDALAHPVADAFFEVVSQRAGFALPLLGLVLVGLCLRFQRDGLFTFLVLLATVGCADLLGNGLKHLISASRPCLDLREVLSWMPTECPGARRGMPSNHAINYFTTAAFLWAALRARRVGVAFTAIACAVGLSRVYLGRHYPSQVAVGALIGVALGLAAAHLWRRTAIGQRTSVDRALSEPPSSGAQPHA
jgi:undecaprenyl-diphosphatase